MVCVSESCPVCQARQSKQSDSVSIDCTVRLIGNWSPSLLISRLDPPAIHTAVSLVDEDFEAHMNITRTVAYHASITVPHIAYYTSEIVFEEERRPMTTALSATNVPSINCTWQWISPHTRTRSTSRCKLYIPYFTYFLT